MDFELTYDSIIKTLFSPDIEKFVPDGESHSLPIVGMVDGVVADCFFLAATITDREQKRITHIKAPTAFIKIDTENKKLLHHSRQLSSQSIDINEIESTKSDSYNIYKKLYVQVRSFAFADSLSERQIEILSQFIYALNAKDGTSCMLIYETLSCEFFKWVNKFIR